MCFLFNYDTMTNILQMVLRERDMHWKDKTILTCNIVKKTILKGCFKNVDLVFISHY